MPWIYPFSASPAKMPSYEPEGADYESAGQRRAQGRTVRKVAAALKVDPSILVVEGDEA
jgi:hypothetical protein